MMPAPPCGPASHAPLPSQRRQRRVQLAHRAVQSPLHRGAGRASCRHPPRSGRHEAVPQQAEVVFDDVLKPGRWVAQHVQHRPAHIPQLQLCVVRRAVRSALRRLAHRFYVGLVEVGVLHHDLRLDGHDDLEHAAVRRVPLLALMPAVPRAQQRQAHLAVRVQVGVEAHAALARRLKHHERRHVGVAAREEEVKHKAAALIRRALRSRQHHAHLVQPIRVVP
mmetsp:Transcript_1430/g.3884  ORF Transcript_1430/g.3884 Transcript_1430/m.3884 type:complete len:222 (-) Transcript_1430:166-831(-)